MNWKRFTIVATLAVLLGCVAGAIPQVCYVNAVRHVKHSAATLARWAYEKAHKPKLYARTQRRNRIRYLLHLTLCETMAVEVPILDLPGDDAWTLDQDTAAAIPHESSLGYSELPSELTTKGYIPYVDNVPDNTTGNFPSTGGPSIFAPVFNNPFTAPTGPTGENPPGSGGNTVLTPEPATLFLCGIALAGGSLCRIKSKSTTRS